MVEGPLPSQTPPAPDWGILGKAAGVRVVVLAYGIALGMAALTVFGMGDRHAIEITLTADVVATVAIFAFSVAFRNASFYDAYWSVAPIVIALYWALGSIGSEAVDARQALVLCAIALWGVRLTFNWQRGWTGLGHEDWRYRDLRTKTGGLYPLVNFLGIHLFPTLIVFVALLPVYAALSVGAQPIGPLDALGVGIVLLAVWLEATADRQLHRFSLENNEPGTTLTSGLWAHSRHPNYLGEILFWWGLYVLGLAAEPSWWWTIVGPAAMTLMFLVISLPMIERRMRERRPRYDVETTGIPKLMPFPRRRRDA